MSEDIFDVIIVGAGPAGVSAAITAARAGLSTVLLERGEYPGAKNVQGAVLYTKMLADLVPMFWQEPGCPMERHITEQNFMLLTKDSAFRAGYKANTWRNEPHNCYTIIRTNFDRWYAKKAEEAGAEVYSGVTVSELLKENGKIAGVKTTEGDELKAHVVIAADGVNSILAQKAGLIDEWRADEVALGVKEVLALPKEKIEDRFNLEGNEGATFEMFGDFTKGMLGYAFLYTNKESLSFGVGCKLSHFQKSGLAPYDILEQLKAHPLVRKLIAGAKPLEYSAHLIPEGGYHSMPPLFADGLLIAGDAAQMINPAHREGSNFAMTAGKLAAETAVAAKKKGDFSRKTLSLYQSKLQNAYILPDLYDHRNLEPAIEARPELLTEIPELLHQCALEYFNIDGRSKRDIQSSIMKRVFRSHGVKKLIRSELTLKNLFKLSKGAIRGALKIKKMKKER